jgi:four helix bundle protein
MEKQELEERTKEFALNVIKFVSNLPRNKVTDVLGYQLLKAGTSVGANYREANRAVSRADFINKIGIVEKEASESQYWLELCQKAEIGDPEDLKDLLRESGELLAIFTRIGKTTKSNLRNLNCESTLNSKSAIRNSKCEPDISNLHKRR